MEWEKIDNYHQRAKIFGGWIVKVYEDALHYRQDYGFVGVGDFRIAICFVPDPEYKWEVPK